MRSYKFIISGGGTGGHIFPAIAIANEIKARYTNAEILFVGALGRMEMEKIPAAGYKIIGLNISGIQRSFTLKNFLVPFRLLGALAQSSKIIKEFKPDAVIGVGGYASAAVLFMATTKGIPALVQEQNSYPGITNKVLSKRVNKLCVAYPNMERFFPQNKIVYTGNPVRHEILNQEGKRNEALQHFGLSPNKKTLLVVGGSLGALSINESILNGLPQIKAAGLQLIWQTGKGFEGNSAEAVKTINDSGIQTFAFIKEMDLAYAAADIVISRAGALAVSELCLVHKASILVPYPFASEDHQTHNAQSLVEKGAALLVKDSDARTKLVEVLLELNQNTTACDGLVKSIAEFGKPEATREIVDEVIKMISV